MILRREKYIFTLPVKVIDNSSIPIQQSALFGRDYRPKFIRCSFLHTQLFAFPVQSHTRSPSVVKFSVGRKYVAMTREEKKEMIAVILIADIWF